MKMRVDNSAYSISCVALKAINNIDKKRKVGFENNISSLFGMTTPLAENNP
jgi:hypothetical protein